MNTVKKDEIDIREIVNYYFLGTYHANIEQIKRAFHPAARITGIIDQQIFDWSLEDFIIRIANSPSAAEKKEEYNKKIVFIDQTNEAAIVKADVAVGPYIFTDYITLLKINNSWIIRNKSFVATNNVTNNL